MEEWNEEQKQKALAKKVLEQKIKRIKNAVFITVLILVLTVGITSAIKGFDFVKDFVLGNETKELVAVSYTHLDVYKRQNRCSAAVQYPGQS